MTTDILSRAQIYRIISDHFDNRWQRNYVRGKLRIDPVYRAAVDVFNGNPLPLLDIGCGMGILGMYLAEHGQQRDYMGVDSDPRKITSARTIANKNYPRMHFIESDAGSLPRFSGNVTILDALHYMPKALQARVLEEAAQRVASGGLLMIRNCLRDSSWRYWATVVEEKFLHWSSWMQVGAQYFPSREEICTPLRDHGLQVELTPLWGRTPYNSYMVLARRA